ncbi:MAG: transcriptional regulator CynR [Betaproteobacteria bacterium]|nr:transcriptional regulator CynR [Betaproteobacteria bacterium]
MPLILRHIRYLIAVAEHGNFTRAAEVLHVSQPTLSQQIRQLEDSLGAQLLDRSGRVVRLTDEGEVFVDHARRALLLFESGRRAIREVNELSRGEIRVGMTPPLAVFIGSMLLGEFRNLYPGITVIAYELTQSAIEQAVVDGTIDVGLAFGDALSPEAVYSTEIDAMELCQQDLRLLVSQDNPVANRTEPITPAELGDLEFALLSPEYALRQHLGRYCAKHGVRLNVKFESNSLGLVLRAVTNGPLVTIAAGDQMRADPGVKLLDLTPQLPKRTAVLLRRHGAFERAACRAFKDVAKRACQSD